MLKDIVLPELGENISSGTVTKILVQPGEAIKKDQPIVELETEKAVLEVPSPLDGIVKKILVKENEEVQVGQTLLQIETELAVDSTPKKEEPLSQPKPPQPPTPPREDSSATKPPIPEGPHPPQKEISPSLSPMEVPASPSVRRFAREIGIDISKVPGSGPHGRISIEDVKGYAKQLNTSLMARGTSSVSTFQPLPDFSKWGPIERKSMSQIRIKTADHMAQAWTTIPHVTQFDKADITDLEALRKQYAQKLQQRGGKLTITAFLLKVVASALKTFPQFNASVNMATKEIIYKKYYHIGVAVDTERGLVVPVIRDVDKKSIVDLAIELNQMAERARQKKTSLEEMQGGTFTITNLGSIGGTYFTPIINAPEVAILGISRASLEPSYNGSTCQPRLMLPLSLSYDHRVIDGADAARFLQWIVNAIHQPFLMELEG